MTQEQETVLLIRGTIASLPDENRKMAEDCYRDLSAMVRKYGTPAYLAIALIGAELAEGHQSYRGVE